LLEQLAGISTRCQTPAINRSNSYAAASTWHHNIRTILFCLLSKMNVIIAQIHASRAVTVS